ncbi:MAG: DUF4169 family protein [Pikeienuella sp.]
MTKNVINLRQARKSKLRADKRATADKNAVRHGMTKAQRIKEKAETDQANRLIDGHKIEKDAPET